MWCRDVGFRPGIINSRASRPIELLAESPDLRLRRGEPRSESCPIDARRRCWLRPRHQPSDPLVAGDSPHPRARIAGPLRLRTRPAQDEHPPNAISFRSLLRRARLPRLGPDLLQVATDLREPLCRHQRGPVLWLPLDVGADLLVVPASELDTPERRRMWLRLADLRPDLGVHPLVHRFLRIARELRDLPVDPFDDVPIRLLDSTHGPSRTSTH